MHPNFLDISYLKTGNKKQKQVFQLLNYHKVMEILKAFSPILVGTIPIGIDIASSDLDIICCWDNKANFIHTLTQKLGNQAGFKLYETIIRGHESVVAQFDLEEFAVEIFGQNIPTKQQMGYRHMCIEHYLLCQKGEKFRQQIIDLKQQGYKTEPAFGVLLDLGNDPYQALLQYEKEFLNNDF